MFDNIWPGLIDSVGQGIIRFGGALLILLVAYIVARLLSGAIRRLLKRTDLDNRLVNSVGGELGVSIENVLASVVFWLIMVFGLIATFDHLNLPQVSQPLNNLLDQVVGYLPSIGGALVLFVVAWVVASLVKRLILRVAESTNLDERLQRFDDSGETQSAIGPSLANAAYWLIFLLFLPAILNALSLGGMLEPVQSMIAEMLAFLPNVIGAAVILLIGWFIARIIRQILTSLLAATPLDSWVERAGLQQRLSTIIGTIIYTFILLLSLISALEALAMPAVSEPATQMINLIFQAIPGIIGAILVLGISYFVARLISGLVADLLAGVGFNEFVARLGLRIGGTRTASQFVGYIVLVGVMLFATLGASELLGFEPLSGILSSFVTFAGQVVLGVVIIGLGLYLANFVRDLVKDAGATQFTATIARTAILVFAIAMGLGQMGVGEDIVNLAFGIMLGALGIAVALAFGLGSRDIAGREVERVLTSIRSDGEAGDAE